MAFVVGLMVNYKVYILQIYTEPLLTFKRTLTEADLQALGGVSSRKMNVPVPVQIDPERKEVEGREMLEEEDETVLPSQCSVCTGPARDHKHYGAVSCYSCRYSF